LCKEKNFFPQQEVAYGRKCDYSKNPHTNHS
jgi:hypothetical protein